jgi:hypothetical protein
VKLPTQDIDVFNNIDFQRVAEYLQQMNWHEEEKIDDRAAIWGYVNEEGKKAEVLLPLTREVPDYASRMDDVFRVLEVVEQRSKAEIFNDLVDVRAIADEKNREVLNLHLSFSPKGENQQSVQEIPAKPLGVILESLQNLFDSIGQVKAGKPNRHGEISKDITDRTNLTILGTLKNPFGIRLAVAPQPAQLDLLNKPLPELVVQEFLEIISQSRQQDYGKLSESLFQLQRRATSYYRNFLLSLIDADLELKVDWGSPNPEKGGSTTITISDAVKTVEIIGRIGIRIPLDYQIPAELIGGDLRKKELKIRDIESDVIISVNVLDEVLSPASVKLVIGRIYDASIREVISITPENQEGTVERTLTAIALWHSDAGFANREISSEVSLPD